MEIEIAVLSKPGGRQYNEDACGFWTSDSLCCAVVSDGAGGHGGGDVASKLVVSTILQDFSLDPQLSSAAILESLRHANRTIIEHQRDERRLRDMRATGTVLLIDQRTEAAQWGHVGDSRVYCFRGGMVFMQTRDHSVIQSVIDGGVGDVSLLRTHPHRNLLLYALGSEDDFVPSVAEVPLTVRDGDAFLLCSDGWWEFVEESAMERALGEAGSVQEWLDAMEAELLRCAKPGHDNYSAVAVWLGSRDETTVILAP